MQNFLNIKFVGNKGEDLLESKILYFPKISQVLPQIIAFTQNLLTKIPAANVDLLIMWQNLSSCF